MAEFLDELVTVGEDAIAEAMALLLERTKMVVEGAGAIGVIALLSGTARPAPSGTTLAVQSGGNVDAAILAAVARRYETTSGRRLVLLTRVSDRPGALAALLAQVAATSAKTAVQLILETRGREHAGAIAGRCTRRGAPSGVVT